LIITILGVVGLYVGKTFEGVKQRPIYIISDTTND
jgi:dolichol-phosphate mannosyltransferase